VENVNKAFHPSQPMTKKKPKKACTGKHTTPEREIPFQTIRKQNIQYSSNSRPPYQVILESTDEKFSICKRATNTMQNHLCSQIN
jgi:hypothetical protein